MKKICFVTGTRADYGILAPIMRKVADCNDTILQVVATNMHMSLEYGETVNEIEADGFKVDAKIASLVPGGSLQTTVLSMAKTQEGLAKTFEDLKPDLVVVLGDRYEALAAASAAVVFNIPIAHLHGGETSLGAIDDKFRHAITQMADLHFAATPQYVEKIVSMGINPDKVYHSGAPGAEIRQNENPEYEFVEKTGIGPREAVILLAMHPVTTLPDKGLSELNATLDALDSYINQGYVVLATMPNSDPGTKEFTDRILEWVKSKNGRAVAVTSLGSTLFHFAMERSLAMVGNSSAALIEAPSHRLGAVNIGKRQEGRAHGITVIDVAADAEQIDKALDTVLSLEMKSVLLGMAVSALNPYYKENSAEFIAEHLIKA